MRLLPPAVLMLLALPLIAQEHPSVTAQPNTVYVGADGKYEAVPDTAIVQFNISAQEDTARAAYDRASKAADQIRQILRSNGIPPSQAQIGFFSLQPVYDWRSPKHKVMAYQVTSAVTLKLTDFQKIAPIVQQLSDMDVTGDQSTNYTLENTEAAKQKAVQDAYQHARDSADSIAHASGRVVSELIYASVDTFEQVHIMPAARTMRAEMAAAAPMPAPTAEFSPQNVTVTAHVNALFGLK